jgi:5-methylcytosine-specific restriction endonuclease McrA
MSDGVSRFTKTAARKVGVTVEEYLQRRADGLKHCRRCRAWREAATFCADRTRYDGLSAVCGMCRRQPRQLFLVPRTRAEAARRRYATDPVYRAERRQHSHARQRGVAPLPAIAAKLLTEEFGGLCAYCPSPATTWDHIVAISKGGRTVPGNIVPACVSCNSSKGASDVRDFIARGGVGPSPALEDALALALVIGELE